MSESADMSNVVRSSMQVALCLQGISDCNICTPPEYAAPKNETTVLLPLSERNIRESFGKTELPRTRRLRP